MTTEDRAPAALEQLELFAMVHAAGLLANRWPEASSPEVCALAKIIAIVAVTRLTGVIPNDQPYHHLRAATGPILKAHAARTGSSEQLTYDLVVPEVYGAVMDSMRMLQATSQLHRLSAVINQARVFTAPTEQARAVLGESDGISNLIEESRQSKETAWSKERVNQINQAIEKLAVHVSELNAQLT